MTSKKDMGKANQRKARTDAWENFLTGSGTSRDKRLASFIRVDSFSQDQTERMWRGDDVIAKLIEWAPEEMLREGIDLRISSLKPQGNADAFPTTPPPRGLLPPLATRPPPPPPMLKPPDQDAKEAAKGAIANWEELEGENVFDEAMKYENAHGGGAILIGANDGVDDLSLPLNEDAIESIDYLTSLTPREVFPRYYYNDIRAKHYGKPEIYQLIPEMFGLGRKPLTERGAAAFPLIHESRLIIFPGVKVSRRQIAHNNGWGDSVLTRAYDVIRDFNSAWTGSAHAMQDFAQAVLKLKDILEMLDSDDPEDQDLLMRRVILMDKQRSVGRMMFIDSEEEFERKETPLTGIPETLDRWCQRLAFTFDVPVSVLFGVTGGGLNSGGNSGDQRSAGNKIRAKQRKKLKPRLEKLFRLIFKAKNGPTKGLEPAVWSVNFRALWQPTDQEKATTRLAVAQADDLNITNNVYGPQDAASHYTGDEYSIDVTIDYEARKQLNESYQEELDNPPEPATAPAAPMTDPTKPAV